MLHQLSIGTLLLSAAAAWAAESKDGKHYTQAPEICPQVRSGSDAQASGDQFKLLPGFQVERLFTVPKDELGSWVSIALDDKGRIIASDQRDKGLCRITPPTVGSREPTRVERLSVDISSAQGMLQAFGAFYVSRNGKGLFRLKDTDGDDQYDEVVLLKEMRGGGEHGEHALRLSPDGKSLLMLAGNATRPPFERTLNAPVQTMGGVRGQPLRAMLPQGARSRLIPNWDEDLLTVRQWDPEGFMAGVTAPGGWIAKTDPDGKEWELIASGFRNPYDMALNADGEILAYDADMEGDAGAPWYRPTRVSHATSGSEFGWRSGSGKWPAYFVDSLPAVVDIGLGSPVGVEFGYGAKFPAKYQRALFLCDFTLGAIHAVHLEPSGSTYTGVKETFLSRNALPMTDAVIGKDGALYFTVGGRNNQSELYRVTYLGEESTAAVETRHTRGAEQRALRREIESYHRPDANPAIAVPLLVKHLASPDRFIRYAARIGLEHIPVRHWMTTVVDSQDADVVITGIVGLARTVEAEAGPKLIARLQQFNFEQLAETQQIEFLRAFELVLIRTGLPDGPGTLATGATMTSPAAAGAVVNTIGGPKLLPGPKTVALGGYFEPFFPSPYEPVNRELATLMVALESPQAAKLLVPILTIRPHSSAADVHEPPDQLQTHIAFLLRSLQTGWNPELRKTYFAWFEKAHTWKGGNHLRGYLTNIDNQAFDNLSDGEKILVEATGQRKPYKVPMLPKPVGPGKEYVLDELVALTSAHLKNRDFEHGKKTFAAARCIICHRFAGEGGATGPDLTQVAGRFSVRDLLESVIDPSKVISDQYKTTNLVTASGKVLTGRVMSLSDTSVTMLVDPEDSTKLVTIAKSEIEAETPSTISLMPKDLLKPLNQEEVLDLAAYLLSRGNKNERFYKK
jgi:putative heme-binding domain-containing protein